MSVQKAYSILSDAQRREKYDKTGEEETMPDIDQKAYQFIGTAISTYLSSALDVSKTSLIEFIKATVIDQQDNCHKIIKQNEEQIRKITIVLERITTKIQSENALTIMLETYLSQHRSSIEQLQLSLAIFDKCQLVLQDYDYKIDEKPVSETGNRGYTMFFGSMP